MFIFIFIIPPGLYILHRHWGNTMVLRVNQCVVASLPNAATSTPSDYIQCCLLKYAIDKPKGNTIQKSIVEAKLLWYLSLSASRLDIFALYFDNEGCTRWLLSDICAWQHQHFLSLPQL